MTGGLMEGVNWQVFQAAAALVGGKMASERNTRIQLAIRQDFVQAYEGLLRAAEEIEIHHQLHAAVAPATAHAQAGPPRERLLETL